ncbi:MAG: hypothetical protein K8F91_03635, partial [Candidatus Obscuribacterales bacterium]|nr:hypothetical protein [Candidatus Obscuribacterales bacterium]
MRQNRNGLMATSRKLQFSLLTASAAPNHPPGLITMLTSAQCVILSRTVAAYYLGERAVLD